MGSTIIGPENLLETACVALDNFRVTQLQLENAWLRTRLLAAQGVKPRGAERPEPETSERAREHCRCGLCVPRAPR